MRCLRSFDYDEPPSLAEASALLAASGGKARLLAGGTDLLEKMKSGAVAPEKLINLKRIEDARLRGLGEVEDGLLEIGALVTLQELIDSPLLRGRVPLLPEAAQTMASHQVRNLATVGGNLCNAAPSADLAPPLLALDAEALAWSPAGVRRVSLPEFFVGPGQTALRPEELLLSVRFPSPPASFRARYVKHTLRNAMDIAAVGVAVAFHLERGLLRGVRIALGAVAPTPLRAAEAEALLEGREPDLRRLEEAARRAAQACAPVSDVRASAEYRREMVECWVRRSFHYLLDRAGQE
ncbi:MAG: xanthine dehydrogenase family protein subunit M [Deltaproteobacteria bacterium]|nr:xanthine dehydrogenase family protein subunit M [Deltaproteobacteria bacterium]